jgi:hypothetical protein
VPKVAFKIALTRGTTEHEDVLTVHDAPLSQRFVKGYLQDSRIAFIDRTALLTLEEGGTAQLFVGGFSKVWLARRLRESP